MKLYIVLVLSIHLARLASTSVINEKSLPGHACEDEVACQFILKGNPNACSNATLNVYCNMSCGLCPTTAPIAGDPCADEPACIYIQQGNTNACSDPTLNTYCNKTCGLCSATTPPSSVPGCADEPSCPFIQQTNVNFCSDPDLIRYCNKTCGLCALLASGGGSTNPCLFHPCVHGQCHHHVSSSGVSFTCDCDLGFIGTRCDHRDPCYSQPCVHGQCTVKDSVGGHQCYCDPGFSGPVCDVSLVRDCQDVLDNNIPSTDDGVYVLDIDENILGSRKLNVKCDFSNNLGWTVLMHRETGQLNFDDKLSSEYSVGFGNISSEFWMGLEYMHALTSDGRQYQLRIDMTVANGSHYYEIYNGFSVGPHNKFELNLGNIHYGSAGDSLSGHANFGFTTKDRDQDSNPAQNCANYVSGGWWFHDCADSCLTCNYVTPGTYDCRSMSWQTLGYCLSLKSVSMKIRPM